LSFVCRGDKSGVTAFSSKKEIIAEKGNVKVEEDDNEEENDEEDDDDDEAELLLAELNKIKREREEARRAKVFSLVIY
jgi:hypothetical protein